MDADRAGERGASAGRARRGRFVSAGLMVLAGTAGFAAIAADVVGHGRLWQMDEPVRAYLHTHAQGSVVLGLAMISGLGAFPVVAAVGCVVGWLLLRRRRWRETVVWASGLVGSGLICEGLKLYFRVPRPMVHTFYAFGSGRRAGYSFPSGHTMAVTVMFGMLVLLAWRGATRGRRRAMVAGAVGMSVVVGFGLMYIGVHALSEVLAGQAAAVAWLGVLRMLMPGDANVEDCAAAA